VTIPLMLTDDFDAAAPAARRSLCLDVICAKAEPDAVNLVVAPDAPRSVSLRCSGRGEDMLKVELEVLHDEIVRSEGGAQSPVPCAG